MELRPFYHRFAWAYDLLQSENVSARLDFIEASLAKLGVSRSARVLDAGCGTGRYAAGLAIRGFKAIGVDRSPELIAVAAARDKGGPSADFIVSDLLTATCSEPFDGVVCRGVLNDFLDDADRRSIFRQFAAWLRPGGILLFDVRLWSETVERYAGKPVNDRTVDLPDGRLRFRSNTRIDHESLRMIVHERFDVQQNGDSVSTENVFVMRPWTTEEVAGFLHSSSLQQIGTGAGYGGSDQWLDRLVVTARKLGA